MSQENLEMIKRLYEVWNGPDGMLAALPMFGAGVEFVNPESAIEPGTRHGYDGMIEGLQAIDEAFLDYVHEPERLLDAGDDKVLAYVTFRARGRDSGALVDKSEQHVWTLHEGKIARFEWFHDETAALRAAGLQRDTSAPGVD